MLHGRNCDCRLLQHCVSDSDGVGAGVCFVVGMEMAGDGQLPAAGLPAKGDSVRLPRAVYPSALPGQPVQVRDAVRSALNATKDSPIRQLLRGFIMVEIARGVPRLLGTLQSCEGQ